MSDSKPKSLIAILALAGVLAVAIFYFTLNPTPGVQPEVSGVPGAAPVEAQTGTQAEQTEAVVAGLYTAECILPSGATLIGEIDIDADEKPEDQKSLSIKNRNTGKVTDVKPAEAKCTFIPVKK